MGYLTLRVYGAASELPSSWCSEPLLDQRNRVLDMLAANSPMNAATFSCCYPLLRQILDTSGLSDSQSLAILRVFEAHADLRSDLETVGLSAYLVHLCWQSIL